MANTKDGAHRARQALDRPQRGPRRWLFRGWIALTILVAGWVAVTAPFARGPALDQSVVALAVPPLMILALGAGIAWLVLLVTRGRGGSDESRGPSVMIPKFGMLRMTSFGIRITLDSSS